MKNDSYSFPRRALILPALLTLLLPALAHAATLTVAADGSGPYPTIQAAVTAAAAGDTVLLGDGTFSGDGNRDVDFAGKSLTVASVNGAARTILDCGGVPPVSDTRGINHRGFYLHSGEAAAVISGLTIKNGLQARDNDIPDSGYGGGICIRGANAAIKNCIITGNTATDHGGGVFNSTDSISPISNTITMTGCTVTGNVASLGGGGGVYNTTFIASNSASGTINLTNCTITGNSALGPNNEAKGGGVFDYCYGPSSTISMTGCTISGNTADVSGGGVGITTNLFATVKLTACTVSGNATLFSDDGDGDGGGIHIYNAASTTTLTNCVLTGNIAQGNGGGFADYNRRSKRHSIRMTNCTCFGEYRPGGGRRHLQRQHGLHLLHADQLHLLRGRRGRGPRQRPADRKHRCLRLRHPGRLPRRQPQRRPPVRLRRRRRLPPQARLPLPRRGDQRRRTPDRPGRHHAPRPAEHRRV